MVATTANSPGVELPNRHVPGGRSAGGAVGGRGLPGRPARHRGRVVREVVRGATDDAVQARAGDPGAVRVPRLQRPEVVAGVPDVPVWPGVDARRGAGGAVQPRGDVAAPAPRTSAGCLGAGPAGVGGPHGGGAAAVRVGGQGRAQGGPDTGAGAGGPAGGVGGQAALGAGAAADAADEVDGHGDGPRDGAGGGDLGVRSGSGEPLKGAGEPAEHAGPVWAAE